MDDDDNFVGPLFISIGDEEKLNVFLDKNPYIPRDMAFVDGYDFDAYQAAGFGRFDDPDNKAAAQEAMSNMGAPKLGGIQGWWNYLSVVSKVSPIPSDMKFGDVPEGVLRLGGTFVVQGDEIVYRWSDRVPGDHPDISNVIEIAKKADADSKQKKQNTFFPSLPTSLAGLFGN